MSDFSFDMAKIKNLKKKIRRLEARLQKGAKKLAKLKRKLEEAGSAPAVKPAIPPKEPRVAAKKKRKLNLTPERRAQLAEAMRARWATKRAAAAASTQDNSSIRGFSVGDSSQPQ
jgi:predicted RNase H-like nuclease (RuvC/YqgF family)